MHYENQKKSCSHNCDYLYCGYAGNVCIFSTRRLFVAFLNRAQRKKNTESEKIVAFFIFFRKLLYKALILCYNY